MVRTARREVRHRSTAVLAHLARRPWRGSAPTARLALQGLRALQDRLLRRCARLARILGWAAQCVLRVLLDSTKTCSARPAANCASMAPIVRPARRAPLTVRRARTIHKQAVAMTPLASCALAARGASKGASPRSLARPVRSAFLRAWAMRAYVRCASRPRQVNPEVHSATSARKILTFRPSRMHRGGSIAAAAWMEHSASRTPRFERCNSSMHTGGSVLLQRRRPCANRV